MVPSETPAPPPWWWRGGTPSGRRPAWPPRRSVPAGCGRPDRAPRPCYVAATPHIPYIEYMLILLSTHSYYAQWRSSSRVERFEVSPSSGGLALGCRGCSRPRAQPRLHLGAIGGPRGPVPYGQATRGDGTLGSVGEPSGLLPWSTATLWLTRCCPFFEPSKPCHLDFPYICAT